MVMLSFVNVCLMGPVLVWQGEERIQGDHEAILLCMLCDEYGETLTS